MRAARCVHGFGFGGPKLMCVVLCGCSRRWCCRSCYCRLIELGLVFPVRSRRATVSAVPPVLPTRRRAMSSYIVRRVPCPVPTPRKLVTPTPLRSTRDTHEWQPKRASGLTPPGTYNAPGQPAELAVLLPSLLLHLSQLPMSRSQAPSRRPVVQATK